ncbi:MAG: Asp-tRNA(Asn)/Glu-tRNA(Gln) amidotransferase subunit GatC [Rhizobiales bacterium]|nr:Asp-tRNA(Asn)/Glu-tRNA(Gln) amidotransferase subunit GatC [Hyphomicrobiales bacterium]
MSFDSATVQKIARLARIAVTDDEAARLEGELSKIFDWAEMLNEVDVEGIEPMTSVMPMDLKKRQDEVTDGGYSEKVVANAPETEDHFFVVPKVVE